VQGLFDKQGRAEQRDEGGQCSACAQSGALDREAAVPLYHQIYLALRDEILSGQRTFGSLVATEKELSRHYAVSRITARSALDELAHHGLVVRKRRLGTTVTFRQPAKPFEANIDQAVDSWLEFGRLTQVKVLEVGKSTVMPQIAEALQIKPGTQAVRAIRIRYLEGESLGYIVSYVRLELSGSVTHAALRDQPMLAVIRRAGYRLGKATQIIAAILADPIISTALGIEPRAAVLRVSRTVCDHTGRPILATIAHYRSDRYHLRLDLNA
jgi:GntR family transcriptional regulator